jgi:hypothetical protein
MFPTRRVTTCAPRSAAFMRPAKKLALGKERKEFMKNCVKSAKSSAPPPAAT